MEVTDAIRLSLAITGLFLLGWFVFALIMYRRTGRAEWLWLGVLMLISLGYGALRFLG